MIVNYYIDLLCDLRSLFPILPLKHSEEETWRDRALQLEGTLREMKTISESERIGECV